VILDILVENCENRDFFIFLLSKGSITFYITTPGGDGYDYFRTGLLQQSQVPGLYGGVNRFCKKKSSVYLQLKCVTDGQTDRQTEMRSQ